MGPLLKPAFALVVSLGLHDPIPTAESEEVYPKLSSPTERLTYMGTPGRRIVPGDYVSKNKDLKACCPSLILFALFSHFSPENLYYTLLSERRKGERLA